jgi:serine/threonine protein kinase
MTQSTLQAVGDYDLLEKIGSGGMSAVYRARHRQTGQLVAVKIASAKVLESTVLRQRFEQEYRVASKLCHPAIVKALAFGEEEGTPYLVLELIDGVDMWQRIEDQGRLSEAEAVRLVSEVGLALHEAHSQAIIHRDVKPENILITAEGKAKLTDLGLIKDLEANLDLTQPRGGLGTPNFMAPEQFQNAKYVDVRSDVYGLAATLYMAVTGEVPFQAKAMGNILRKKLNNELIPPRQLVRSLSEHLDWTIRRALQANPKQRHADCLEFVQALAGGPTPAPKAEARAAARVAAPGNRPSGSSRRERRSAVRYPCTLKTACHVRISIHQGAAETQECWPATIRNLSVKGMGVQVKRRFEPRTVLSVSLASRHRSYTRKVELRVMRVQKAQGGEWIIGGAFVEHLTKEELRKLV